MKYEGGIGNTIESGTETDEQLVGYFIEQFPAELQDRLYTEIESLDDKAAISYLTTKLINRRYALQTHNAEQLRSAGIEVIKEIPHAISRSIERSYEEGRSGILGNGKNGEVIKSINTPNTCYKVLFIERANELIATAAREAYLQHQAHEVLVQFPHVAQVPAVLRYVDHKDLRAIHMEVVDGVSLESILNGNNDFPDSFDVDSFCRKLEEAILILNQNGLFHRDLLYNPGNVIVDKNGNPSIIDFGTAIRSVVTEDDGVADRNSYRVTLNGRRIMGNDQSAVTDFRRKILNRINIATEHEHG